LPFPIRPLRGLDPGPSTSPSEDAAGTPTATTSSMPRQRLRSIARESKFQGPGMSSSLSGPALNAGDRVLGGIHRLKVELGVAEQCQLDSLAESLDICLIEEELVGALPVAALGSAVGQRQHVGSHVLDRGQDATVLGREQAGQAVADSAGGR
jgi:hypothetical protein